MLQVLFVKEKKRLCIHFTDFLIFFKFEHVTSSFCKRKKRLYNKQFYFINFTDFKILI